MRESKNIIGNKGKIFNYIFDFSRCAERMYNGETNHEKH